MATRYDILDGPSKWDLMLALFDISDNKPRTVDIMIEHYRLPAVIRKVERESGSGESWLIEGHFLKKPPFTGSAEHWFTGWFQTHTRKGWLEI